MLTGIRKMEIRDVPVPRIGSDRDVMVRIETVGVCGSDVHYYANGGIGAVRVEYRSSWATRRRGREEVGSGVARVAPGPRRLDPAIVCGSATMPAGPANTRPRDPVSELPRPGAGLPSPSACHAEENCLRAHRPSASSRERSQQHVAGRPVPVRQAVTRRSTSAGASAARPTIRDCRLGPDRLRFC